MVELTNDDKKAIVYWINKTIADNEINNFYNKLEAKFENKSQFQETWVHHFTFSLRFFIGRLLTRFIYFDFDDVVKVELMQINENEYNSNERHYNSNNTYLLERTKQIIHFEINQEYLKDICNQITAPIEELVIAANNEKMYFISPKASFDSNKEIQEKPVLIEELKRMSLIEDFYKQKDLIKKASGVLYHKKKKINLESICKLIEQPPSTMRGIWERCDIEYNGDKKEFYVISSNETFLECRNFSPDRPFKK